MGGIGREVGRKPLLALAAEAGIKATQARDILDQVCEATARLQKER